MDAISARDELDYLVRALSHDMNANFMLLENSFSQLKRSLVQLQRGILHDEIHRRVEHVDACLHESKRFLSDLVRLAKTGSVEMEPDRVELLEVVQDVLFEHHDLLRRHRVEVDVRRPLPILWCNRARLKQIVTNLVRNAVFHGCNPQSPRITVASCLPEKDPVDRTAAFRVHDNGPGMDLRYRREVFLPGRRLAQSGVDGSGMGLAIVKKICEHYGGCVYIDAECGSGTALVVNLPSAEVARQEAVAEGRRWKLDFDARHTRTSAPRTHGVRPAQPHT